MNDVSHEIVVVTETSEFLSLDALAGRAGMHPALIERYVEIGLLNPCKRDDTRVLFDSSAVLRLGAINRLRQSLGINLAGVAVVLDLIDRIAALQLENECLRRRADDGR